MAEENTDKKTGMGALVYGRNPRRTLFRIVILLILAFVVFRFVLKPIRVTGISMFPTYKDGQVNFVNLMSYWKSEPQRGDVVAVHDPKANLILLKRIIGLPGETVIIDHGIVLVNGKELGEKAYVKVRQPWTEEFQPLPDNFYLLIGDNRSMPVTAHTHGAFHRTNFLGKVLF